MRLSTSDSSSNKIKFGNERHVLELGHEAGGKVFEPASTAISFDGAPARFP